ncbi:histidine phosphatase family protein [Glaciimonas immobilis]|uniref:Putative phosphoglycerate mutase n=1 Tax=Glaciimonas immobilis TaxID=728004 RepID=A0A840RT18_9BURK|nr:histidine phosphatase family protein [Glaciimonas immobilis]KAF3999658.1 histidine phosphatase family protein [Glaciimonas immobilis]MBB5200096.1 putative phosphoglycerate mutase [Glaciimonas immobilis]
MQTTEILLIRHGETDWNTEKRIQGHIDIPLNAKGRRQAAALSTRLEGLSLDAIFSSDLQRARDTAAPVAAHHGLTVQIHEDLRERCYGVMEGLQRQEVALRYPLAYAALDARALDVRYPPGINVAETINEFSARAIGALHRLLNKATHQRIAVVSHGGVLDCIYRHVSNVALGEARAFDILNASINRLLWNGEQFKLVSWGDIEHLSHLGDIVLDEVDK